MHKIKVLILLIIISSASLRADDKFWFSTGFGVGDNGLEYWQPYPSYPISFNYASGNKLFRFRHYYNTLTRPFSEFTRSARDLGLLYGYRKEFNKGSVSACGGIGLVTGHYYEYLFEDYVGYYYDRKTFNAAGFPFEAQIEWNTFKYFGIGLSIYGDLNTEMSFYGVMLNFNIGVLK